MEINDPRMLLRRKDAAEVLAISESQLLKWERAGVIVPVQLPGLRSIRYRATDIRSLAVNIANGRLSTEPTAETADRG